MLGNSCFNSGQLCSGPCEAWVPIKTNSRWRREARRTTADDMMSTEMKYYCMNNLTFLHFSYWFEIAIPDVFMPLNCNFKPITEM